MIQLRAFLASHFQERKTLHKLKFPPIPLKSHHLLIPAAVVVGLKILLKEKIKDYSGDTWDRQLQKENKIYEIFYFSLKMLLFFFKNIFAFDAFLVIGNLEYF